MLHIKKKKNHHHSTLKYLVCAISLESAKKSGWESVAESLHFFRPVYSDMLDWEYYGLNGPVEE